MRLCDFVSDGQIVPRVPPSELDKLVKKLNRTSLMIERTVDLYLEEAKDVASKAPDVIVCILSPKLLKRIDVQGREQNGQRGSPE